MPKSKRTSPQSSTPAGPPPNIEQILANLSRVLGNQEFASLDEAKAYLEQMLANGVSFENAQPATPLDEAEQLIYQAWEARSPTKRVQLAHQALTISPDCADAYVILAEDAAKTPHESLQYYRDAVAAGERALGSEFFQEQAGYFWGLVETRPYMRARYGLAENLVGLGRRIEAVEHMEALLGLNPGDNQGVRYLLASVLLDIGAHDELKALLDKYPEEESTPWCYSRALMLYCQTGPSQEAAEALHRAFAANAYVPEHLVSMTPPKYLSEFIEPGSEAESFDYIGLNAIGWMRTLGAMEWLDSVWRQARGAGRAGGRRGGSTAGKQHGKRR